MVKGDWGVLQSPLSISHLPNILSIGRPVIATIIIIDSYSHYYYIVAVVVAAVVVAIQPAKQNIVNYCTGSLRQLITGLPAKKGLWGEGRPHNNKSLRKSPDTTDNIQPVQLFTVASDYYWPLLFISTD